MTGNGKHTTYKNGDDWGMVYYYCFTHIIEFHLNPYKLPYNAMGSFALKSGWSLMSFWYLPMDINFRMAAGYGTRLFYAFKNNQRTQQTLAFWCCFYPTATISTAGPGSHFRWAPRLAHFLPADRSLWGSLQRDGIWTQLASLQFTAIIPDEKHDIFFHSYFWTTPLTFTIFLQFFTMWVCLPSYIPPKKWLSFNREQWWFTDGSRGFSVQTEASLTGSGGQGLFGDLQRGVAGPVASLVWKVKQV